MKSFKAAVVLPTVLILTAPVYAQSLGTRLIVQSHMDIYRAGGYDDGSDGITPVSFGFSAKPGQLVTFEKINGTWDCGITPEYGPDGDFGAGSGCGPFNILPTGPFSGYQTVDFTGGLVGVFLEDKLPLSRPPRTLRFFFSNSSEGGIPANFLALNPGLGQVFFIGDGLTGTGSGGTQVFAVPPTATHLYLGYADSGNNANPGGFYNNVGALEAIVALHNTR